MSRGKVHKSLWGNRLRRLTNVLERSSRLCNIHAAGSRMIVGAIVVRMGLSSKNPPTFVEGFNSPNLRDHPLEGFTHLPKMILAGFPCGV